MKNESSIENQVNQSLDESIENLSPEVRRALNQSRHKALEATARSNWRLTPMHKLAVGASFLLVVSFSWQFFTQVQEENVTPFAAVLDEDLEMLNDLEFVYWLAEESESAVL
jgi:hypothetical protein